eukprot:3737566-Rhodomonas_salina.3
MLTSDFTSAYTSLLAMRCAHTLSSPLDWFLNTHLAYIHHDPQTHTRTQVWCPMLPGTYKDVAGSSACSLCPPDTYSWALAATDALQCLSCPYGSSSPAGSNTIM